MWHFNRIFGAGEGNRTLVIILEGWMMLRDIRNIAAKPMGTAPIGVNGLRSVCKTGPPRKSGERLSCLAEVSRLPMPRDFMAATANER